jgi:hypothetical protein
LLFCSSVLPFVVLKHFIILVFGLLVGSSVDLGFGQGLGLMRRWVGLVGVFGLLGLMGCEVARRSCFGVEADRKDCKDCSFKAVLVLVVVVACFDMG